MKLAEQKFADSTSGSIACEPNDEAQLWNGTPEKYSHDNRSYQRSPYPRNPLEIEVLHLGCMEGCPVVLRLTILGLPDQHLAEFHRVRS